MLLATRVWIREFGLGWGGSPAYPNALDFAGLASSGPGFRPPPPRAPLSPGQRKKPTPRPPPRALTSREAPGPLWARPPGRTPAESPAGGPQPARAGPACVRASPRQRHPAGRAGEGRGVRGARGRGAVRWEHPANYSPLQRCEPSPTCRVEVPGPVSRMGKRVQCSHK